MTSHARVTVQITTGFHSWSGFFWKPELSFFRQNATIVVTIETDVHLAKNRLKEIKFNGKCRRHLPFGGVIGSAHNVLVNSTWLSESLLDSFHIRRHALKPQTKFKVCFYIIVLKKISFHGK